MSPSQINAIRVIDFFLQKLLCQYKEYEIVTTSMTKHNLNFEVILDIYLKCSLSLSIIIIFLSNSGENFWNPLFVKSLFTRTMASFLVDLFWDLQKAFFLKLASKTLWGKMPGPLKVTGKSLEFHFRTFWEHFLSVWWRETLSCCPSPSQRCLPAPRTQTTEILEIYWNLLPRMYYFWSTPDIQLRASLLLCRHV